MEDIAFDRRDPVEDQHAVKVIDLVLERAGLEAFRDYDEVVAVGSPAVHDEMRGPRDVRGEVRDAHAPFPSDLATGYLDDDRIEHHYQAVRDGRLRVRGHVEGEGATRYAYLRGSKAHASRRRSHGVDEISRQLVVDTPDLF